MIEPTYDRWVKKSLVERYRNIVNVLLYLVVALAAFFYPIDRFSHWHSLLQTGGLILVLIAMVGRIWCSAHVFGRKSKDLCTDGPHSLCRNPLYIFSFCAGLGIAAQTGAPLIIVLFTAISWTYYLAVISAEERRLKHMFGKRYDDYVSSTHRFVPHVEAITHVRFFIFPPASLRL